MTKKPSVSVLMPVYNCAPFLNDAIDSILSQSYRDFELIIVNDGSTDNTAAILDGYAKLDGRIRIITKPNQGIVSALNHGLSEAKGDWIFRMDGDDISLSHRFESQITEIQKDASLVLLGGWCQQIDEEGSPIKVNRYPAGHEQLVRALEYVRPFPPHPTACYPRGLAFSMGGYNERFRHAEDYDLWLRLSTRGKIGCCQNVVLKLRKHPQNISNLNSGYDQQLRGIAAAVCHFRRKKGLSDPSIAGESDWNAFVAWLADNLREIGYFDREREWLELKKRCLSSPGRNPLRAGSALFKGIITNSHVRKALLHRFTSERVALKLAEQSRFAIEL